MNPRCAGRCRLRSTTMAVLKPGQTKKIGAERRARSNLADATPQRNTVASTTRTAVPSMRSTSPGPGVAEGVDRYAAAYWRLIATRSSSSGLMR
jgi:hypothetical protein